MELSLPHTRMIVSARVVAAGSQLDHFVYEGEAQMAQAQQDYYKQLIGDGLSKVTVSRDEAVKDFGNGGGVMVTVTLACDQSEQGVQAAISLAYTIADGAVKYYSPQIKQDLINRGILRPA